MAGPHTSPSIPVIDVAALVAGEDDLVAAREIDAACRDTGFFLISGHGVPVRLLNQMEAASVNFFNQSRTRKAEVAMEHGGAAWRGW